jgi:hypothetical protein
LHPDGCDKITEVKLFVGWAVGRCWNKCIHTYTYEVLILLLVRTHYQRQIEYLHTFTHTLQITAKRTRTTIVLNNFNKKHSYNIDPTHKREQTIL